MRRRDVQDSQQVVTIAIDFKKAYDSIKRELSLDTKIIKYRHWILMVIGYYKN